MAVAMTLPNARLVPLAILAVCAAALGGALFLEHVLDVQPCILCLWQRVPFAVAGVLAAVALLPGLGPRVRRAIVAVCGLVFLVNMGIAGFHVGVEQHWWEGTAQCAAPTGGAPQSLAEMRAALESPPQLARCDEVAWSLFGISLPGYNVVLSLVLGAASLFAARRAALWNAR
ncbi:disulfide bond formation protein B [Caenispirillum salinarum]|uniref:disulfide bond formation protein B n=1 Tax=Caenispirillum salinarum TaxID=859058 RepID=UPI00384FAB45